MKKKTNTIFVESLLAFAILMSLCGMLNAQAPPAPATDFVHSIGDSLPVDFIQHSVANYPNDGTYIIAGTVVPGPLTGDSDILVLKTDNGGNILWSNYVDYGADEFVGSVKVDATGNIVLTGYTGQNNTGNKNLIIAKLDGNGNYVDDVVIADPNMGYGLYGFDIEQTNAGGYIVVGTGVQDATQAAPKYAFVLQVDNALTNIGWSFMYQSTFGFFPGPTNYDSFNHILKVSHPTHGETYLLTGSGASPAGDQMVACDLIDPAGVQKWVVPAAYRPSSSSNYDYSGVMAIYDAATDNFFVLHPSVETMPGLLKLDGGGNILDSYLLHNHTIGDFNTLVNGMVWEGGTIAFSGYHFGDLGLGAPVFFRMDVSGPTPVSVTWEEFGPYFDAGALTSTSYDFIVQPINRSGPFSGSYNAIYYQPKALVGDFDGGYRFANPQDVSGTLGLNVIKTDPAGTTAVAKRAMDMSIIFHLANSLILTSRPIPWAS